MRGEKHERQDGVRARRAEQHDPVGRDRYRREVVFVHPPVTKGTRDSQKKQVQVRPQRRAVHVMDRMEHVVMIVPVDADEHEAQHVAEEHRNERRERLRVGIVRNLQLQHHDRDDDPRSRRR